jgi:translocation and assembly module TamB
LTARLTLPLRLVLLMAALLVPIPASSGSDDEGFLGRVLQSYLSDAGREVRIRGFDGALSSRATLDELTIADDQGVWLILRGAVLDWNRAALFERRIEINDLSAREIEILRLPRQDRTALPRTTARVGLPQLPVSVEIGRIGADQVRLHPDVAGQDALLTVEGRLNLRDRMGDVAIQAERIDGSPGVFRISANLDEANGHLDLEALFDEARGGLAATLLGIPDQPALHLSIAGAGRLRGFQANVEMTVNGARSLSGFVAFPETHGTGVPEDTLTLHVDLEGDLRPLVVRDLQEFFGARSRLRGIAHRKPSGEILLEDLILQTATLRLQGRADLREDGLPRLVLLSGDLRDPQGRPVVLPGSGGQTRLGTAMIEIDFDASQSSRWRIDMSLSDLVTPQAEARSLALQGNGELRLDGSTPLMDGALDVQALGLGSGNEALERAFGREIAGFASLLWHDRTQPLDITGLVLESQTLALSGYGRLENGTFDGFLETDIPDIAVMSGLAARGLAGSLLATAEGSFSLWSGAFDLALSARGQDIAVDQDELDRLLTGASLLRARLARTRAGTDLADLYLSSGSLTVTGQGKARPTNSSLEVSLDMRDLAALGPQFAGRARLEARYETLMRRERLRLSGTTRDLRPGATGGDALAALLAGETQLQADLLRVGDRMTLQVAQLENPRFAVSVQGFLDPRGNDLTVDLSRMGLDSLLPGLAGSLTGQSRIMGPDGTRTASIALEGRLRTGVPEIDRGLDGGQLALSATVNEQDGGLSLSDARLTGGGIVAQAQGRLSGETAGDFRLSVDLDNLARFVPGVQGPVALALRATPSQLRAGQDIEATLSGPAAMSVALRGTMEPGLVLDLTATGQVDAAIANPSIEPVLVQGLVGFSARMQGAPRIENLRATAQARDARVIAPRDGVAFHDITASASLTGTLARVQVAGRAERGGSATIAGSIRLDRRRDAELDVTADRLTILQPRLFSTTLSGTGRISGPLALGARLSGRVAVHEAEIRIPASTLARAPRLPAGLRHVNEAGQARATRRAAGIASGTSDGRRPPPLYLDLLLENQGRVFVRGRGLDAELGGRLHLGGSTHDVIPGGAFDLIRGRLDFLGNRFTLTEGTASMIGSFVPFVQLSASTESDGVLTSIIVEGEADRPQIRFASVPELPDDEILARLIFRRALTSLTPFQAAQLGLSVATLTGLTDEGILQRTRNRLGLHDLDLLTTDAGEVELRAGRYVSERVYTDVGVDTQGRGRVSVQIDLSPTVTLRGRTDSTGRSGVGLFFERDY